MSTLDIRTQSNEPVDTIIVGDCHPDAYSVDTLVNYSIGKVALGHKESDDSLIITSEQHARDIIKGIEKAIELGWFKECK